MKKLPKIKKQTDKKQTSKNKELYRVMYVFMGLFLTLSVFLSYFLIAESRQVIDNPYNLRQDNFAKKVVRGNILGNGGEILAETVIKEDGTEVRNYPYANIFAHVVGYSQNGKTGIEKQANFDLLTSDIPFYEKIYRQFSEEKFPGNQIVTTLNVELQKMAYDALGNYNGAVVALEPSTGKILAMVSKPDYNPNEILEIWEDLTKEGSTDSSLLNRASQGLYPPGSTFKILTALEYIRENPNTYLDYSYQCKGIFSLDNADIKCYHGKVHGIQDLKTAFANSCNGAFAQIGSSFQLTQFQQLCQTFLFNQELPVSFASNASSFTLVEGAPTWEVLQSSIGQGKTEITPLHNALITASIANGGILMKPYLIEKVENAYGVTVESYMPSIYQTLMTTEEAAILTEMMTACVTDGTGTGVKSSAYTAAGKTGTAEWDEKKESHAWFVGFAPAENPQIVVCVIVEETGTGSDYAVPIARKIFDAYLLEK